jgi:hypothetical protein
MPLPREDLLFLLHQACILFDQACTETPDWIRVMSGANPKALESAAEVAKDTYSIDETGEI